MSLITRMRRQDAIYWPPSDADGYGRPTVGVFVELKVRWEGRVEEFTDREGTTHISNAVVYVPELPSGSEVEVEVGGWMFLGGRYDLEDEDDPRANPGAYEVRRVDHLPNLRNTEKLRAVYL